MARKKILIVARWPVGGIRTYFRYIYSQPIFQDYTFTFVMPELEQVTALIEANLPEGRFEIVICKEGAREIVSAAYREMNRERFDLIHSHGYTAGMLMLPVQWKTKTAHLLTTHDVFSDATFFGFKGWVKRVIMRFVLGAITKVMPVGSDAQDNLHTYFPALNGRTHAIRNGIPTEDFFNGVKRNLKQEIGLEESIFLVGFFGRFMAQKGFRYLVEAVKQLNGEVSEKKLHVVCFGWGGFIREEQANLKQLGIDHFFTFMPQTNDMPAAIKGVDLVAMPSLWEACPLLPMEVLSAGIPIVGTTCIGSKEVFNDTPAYITEPRDAEGLVKAIKSEMNAPSKEKFEMFSKVALSRFSNQESAKQLCQLYEEMIERPVS